ncbi:MAG: hypothetical protein WCI36_02990 [bacterium]
MEIRNMGAFDDFTLKCFNCKAVLCVYDLKFKTLDEKNNDYGFSGIDKMKKSEYDKNAKLKMITA